MLSNLKSGSALAALVCIGVGSMTGGASAISAKVAKKCDALCTSAPASDPGSDREQHTASHYQQISGEREKRLRIRASNAHSIARKAG